ncbi:type II toxin-antitoxin system VapC family toxin [Streptomyces microflavus]|uniref:Type II toxin-antitoxin system VapC family toxin n=1 Tax=Streptomyces microflavus TaxID=1919 RepID=A0A6N9V169_STRMI|nr:MULTISPECIES: type II toxin-antitoxin system VapC family toxin [Streptomyces]MBK5990971.1 type II toxin-antitoxin system VapC family toxin [Streptomyces sp. MBT58]NEB66423.1 type II toxin-antitoxin system VapC family toxin [Streptomyces microflavus]QQZ56175.1 type II toxin-antitoxin system VapC family toxin [Streptomyces microflavus]QTA34417.1 Ribonuclease VapC22 [Streptomyces sp. CA-256286]WSR93603.1 type II toxin-antitoxin system VapC family toxin [Streptomyces microflavus]
MRLLLDTHVILWWLGDSDELSDQVKDLLDTEPSVHLSAVSAWEIAIKQSLGKLDGPDDLAERVRDSQFTSLPITAGHGVRAGRLPALHRDPFDRILVAQAQIEGMTVVTRDKWIPQYDVPVMAV